MDTRILRGMSFQVGARVLLMLAYKHGERIEFNALVAASVRLTYVGYR